MDLVKEAGRPISKDNFGAEVKDGKLVVPLELLQKIERTHFQFTEQLISLMVAYPSSFVHCLGWSLKEVETATEGLKDMLRGYIENIYLDPVTPQKHSSGLMPPLHDKHKPDDKDPIN